LPGAADQAATERGQSIERSAVQALPLGLPWEGWVIGACFGQSGTQLDEPGRTVGDVGVDHFQQGRRNGSQQATIGIELAAIIRFVEGLEMGTSGQKFTLPAASQASNRWWWSCAYCSGSLNA
jgi:hypothetical protein